MIKQAQISLKFTEQIHYSFYQNNNNKEYYDNDSQKESDENDHLNCECNLL